MTALTELERQQQIHVSELNTRLLESDGLVAFWKAQFVKYGGHLHYCSCNTDVDGPCDCGYRELMFKVKE